MAIVVDSATVLVVKKLEVQEVRARDGRGATAVNALVDMLEHDRESLLAIVELAELMAARSRKRRRKVKYRSTKD